MKQIKPIYIIIGIVIIFFLISSQGNQIKKTGHTLTSSINRVLPSTVKVNTEFDIGFNPVSATAKYGGVITETIPIGFTYVASGTIGQGGFNKKSGVGQIIEFAFYCDIEPCSFYYALQSPSTAGTGKTFNGTFQYAASETQPTVSGTITGNTQLNVVCNTIADIDCSGIISTNELLNFIQNQWVTNLYDNTYLLSVITEWLKS